MNKKGFFAFMLLVLVLFCVGVYFLRTNATIVKLPILFSPSSTPPPKQHVASDSAEIATVLRAVDGDTIELTDGRKVRYIGVDTPELHHPTKGVQCFGQEAMEKNKELVEGKMIQMKKDVSETDRYKRLLRYVWVNDIFVNEYLVKEGYAHQVTFPPDVKYVELFRSAAEEARIKNKGLWNKCK